MPAYATQLLLKHILYQGVSWAPDGEIVYRDQTRLTYTGLYERILRLGSALASLGAARGMKVGVIEWDSHRYLEMYFGIPGMGAVMHTVNPGLAPEDVLYTINHAEDEILVYHEDFLPLVEKLRPSMRSVRRFVVIRENVEITPSGTECADYEGLLFAARPLAELPDLPEDSMATLSYTTGTTGKPKGVYFSQRQITLQSLSDAVALSALGSYGGVSKHDVYMPLTPMFHGHAWGMPYVATMLGIKQVFAGRYEMGRVLRLMSAEKVTFSHCVPSILQNLLRAMDAEGVSARDWKIIVGGSALSKSLAEEAVRHGILPYGGYGLSETCPVLTIANLKPFMESWDEEKQLDWLVKPGFTLPLVRLSVVNAQGKEVVRDDTETGEVLVRGPWCTPGYYREESLSEKLWEGGWLHTGDVASVDEHGYIRIVDRLKDVIKSGGEWIVSQELERLICLHPSVTDAAVIGVPDETWGERPLALVTLQPDLSVIPNEQDLRVQMLAFVDSGTLAPWAVPDRFIVVDKIPRTSVGKADKKVLRASYGC